MHLGNQLWNTTCMSEQLLRCHHHSDCADWQQCRAWVSNCSWTNQQFQASSNWLPLPLGKQSVVWTLGCARLTTARETQWCIYRTQVPPLYTSSIYSIPTQYYQHTLFSIWHAHMSTFNPTMRKHGLRPAVHSLEELKGESASVCVCVCVCVCVVK